MAKKKDNNVIPELKEQIKNNSLKNMYVFFGEEEYLKEHYIKKIQELIPDNGFAEYNNIVITGDADYNEYDSVLESMPFMADRRVVVIRDSNIFTASRAGGIMPPNDEQKKFWTDKFKKLSDDTVLIFCEKNVDKRSALFKAAQKAGFMVECNYMADIDLRAWVVKRALKAGKKIDNSVADYLISVIDKGMNNLENEIDKLISYSGDVIYKSDIDKITSKALEVQAFDITDGLISGDVKKALSAVYNLRTQKQSAFAVLYLMYSNVEKMLKLKLVGATNQSQAGEVLKTTGWLARKYLDGAREFSLDSLYYMVMRVPEVDYEIKSGLIEEWQAVEQYILNSFGKRGSIQ